MNIENLKVGDVQEHQRKMMVEGGDRAQRRWIAAVKGGVSERQRKVTRERDGGRSQRNAVAEQNLHSREIGKMLCF